MAEVWIYFPDEASRFDERANETHRTVLEDEARQWLDLRFRLVHQDGGGSPRMPIPHVSSASSVGYHIRTVRANILWDRGEQPWLYEEELEVHLQSVWLSVCPPQEQISKYALLFEDES